MAPLFVGVESGCFVKNGINVETVAQMRRCITLSGWEYRFRYNHLHSHFLPNSGVLIKTISAAGGWGVMQVIAKDYVGASSSRPQGIC